jgi:hypothetical protein
MTRQVKQKGSFAKPADMLPEGFDADQIANFFANSSADYSASKASIGLVNAKDSISTIASNNFSAPPISYGNEGLAYSHDAIMSPEAFKSIFSSVFSFNRLDLEGAVKPTFSRGGEIGDRESDYQDTTFDPVVISNTPTGRSTALSLTPKINSSDISQDPKHGLLEGFLQHGILHAMGFGTAWTDIGLVHDDNGNLRFNGTNITLEYNTSFELIASCYPLVSNGTPIKTDSGSSAARKHSDAATFGREIMPTMLNHSNSMTQPTVATLNDTGHQTTCADQFLFA